MEERERRGDVINNEMLFFPCTRHQCILGTVSSILGVDVILLFWLHCFMPHQREQGYDDAILVISSVPSEGLAYSISVFGQAKRQGIDVTTLQLCQAFFTGECGNKKLSSADDSLCVLCWKWPLKKEQTVANYFSCSFKSCIQKIAYNYIMLFVLLKESTIWIVAGKKNTKQYTHNYKVLPSDLQLNQLNQHLQEKQNPLRM